jgi:hypothetical protein
MATPKSKPKPSISNPLPPLVGRTLPQVIAEEGLSELVFRWPASTGDKFGDLIELIREVERRTPIRRNSVNKSLLINPDKYIELMAQNSNIRHKIQDMLCRAEIEIDRILLICNEHYRTDVTYRSLVRIRTCICKAYSVTPLKANALSFLAVVEAFKIACEDLPKPRKTTPLAAPPEAEAAAGTKSSAPSVGDSDAEPPPDPVEAAEIAMTDDYRSPRSAELIRFLDKQAKKTASLDEIAIVLYGSRPATAIRDRGTVRQMVSRARAKLNDLAGPVRLLLDRSKVTLAVSADARGRPARMRRG